ncbi:MAG: alpha/beta hydrolase [Polyangiaceae bacterium]|nr:alpha/beta hydrolase [Polyangiaceae bacterium]
MSYERVRARARAGRQLRLHEQLRHKLGQFAVDGFFHTAARLGKLHPAARPERHGVEIHRDLGYLATGLAEHRLDVYRPRERSGPLPAVFYVHGGGFRILSKDTHWLMGLAFARAGYVVFNVSYRLAPTHPFPAGLGDVADALGWVADNAAHFGARLDRLAFAGESAGANLVTALGLMTCYRRPEPFAARVFELGLVPRAVLPYCGILQVSDSARFLRRKPALGAFLDDRLCEVEHAYLGDDLERYGASLDLADPLVVLERGDPPTRALPPFFVAVGTRDPLLDDTRRLKAALDRLGTPCEARYYEGEVHAFHALVWRKQARRCWADSYAFLRQHLDA